MSREALFHVLSAGLLVMIVALGAAGLRDFGITEQEPSQHRYGNRVVRWYHSLGQDDAAVQGESRLQGGFFELVAQLAERVSPLGVYDTRHLASALFGLIGVLAAWWIGVQLAGGLGGLLAAAVLAATPLYLGSSFNDARDVAFAALFALAAASLTSLRLDRLPGPGWRVLLGLLGTGALIGLAAAVRVTGITLLGLSALAWLICMWEARADLHSPARPLWRDFGRIGLDLAIIGSTAWLSMVLFWPYAQLDPVGNPLRALEAELSWGRDQLVLWGGRPLPAAELPRGSLLRLFLLTLPETYLLAAIMGAWRIAAVLRHSPLPGETWTKLRHFGWLVTVCALPLLWTVVARTPHDGSSRSLLFLAPLLAGLAGASAAWWLRSPLPVLLRLAGGLLLAAALGLVVRDIARLHPYETAYYNRLFGGGLAKSAPLYGAFDGGSAAKAALEWIASSYPTPPGARVRVASGEEPVRLDYYLSRMPEAAGRFEAVRPEQEPKLLLVPTAHREDERTPGRVVHVVERMGWPLLKVFELP